MVLPVENKPPKVHLEDSSHIRIIKKLIDYFDKIKNKLENPDDGNFRTTTADTNVNDKEKHKAQAEKLQRELCNVTRELSNFWKLDDLVASSCSGLDSNPRLDLHTVPETPAQLEDTFRLVAEMVQNLKRKVKAAEEPFTLTFEPYYLVHNEKNEGLGMRNRIETKSYYLNCLHYDPVGMFGKLKDEPRECLKYFSVFPENAVLRKNLLKNWWIGEGLFANTPEGRGKVDEALIHLLKKGFIEPFLKKRKLVGFKVDPLIRFVLIKMAEHEKFSSFNAMGVPVVTSTTEKAFLVKHGEYCSRNELANDVLHHEIRKTLFNVNDSYPDFKEDWFSKLRNLEALSLGGLHGLSGQEIQDTENNKDFKFKDPHGTRGLLRQHIEIEDAQFLKGMKKMKKLKFLGLQGISRLMKIPESIGNLSKLEVLDLCACHNLESLPKGLVKLKNLTHLDLSECYLLDIIPKGVASLSKLQVLKGFRIGSSTKGGCSLADLKSLRDLRKLSIYTNDPEFPSEKDLTALKSFKSRIWR